MAAIACICFIVAPLWRKCQRKQASRAAARRPKTDVNSEYENIYYSEDGQRIPEDQVVHTNDTYGQVEDGWEGAQVRDNNPLYE